MMTVQQAYDEACRQLGHAQVEIAALRGQLAEVTAERDEAGRRIVELTGQSGP